MPPRTWYLGIHWPRYYQKGLNFCLKSQPIISDFTAPIVHLGYEFEIWVRPVAPCFFFCIQMSPLSRSVRSGTILLIMGRHTTRSCIIQHNRCFDKREVSNFSAWSLTSFHQNNFFADENVFWTLFKPFNIRHTAWIYLHVHNRWWTILHTFARGKGSWRRTSCSYWQEELEDVERQRRSCLATTIVSFFFQTQVRPLLAFSNCLSEKQHWSKVPITIFTKAEWKL